VASLDRLEPIVAAHHERACRARPDEHEIPMHQRAQPVHVAAAQSIAPFVLERLDYFTAMVRHAFLFAPSLRRKKKKASRRNERLARRCFEVCPYRVTLPLRRPSWGS